MSNQSIVSGYLTAHRLWRYSALPLIIFLGLYLLVGILPHKIAYALPPLLFLVMHLIAVYASIILALLNVLQSKVIAFLNTREALRNGFLAIITHDSDELRAIADDLIG